MFNQGLFNIIINMFIYDCIPISDICIVLVQVLVPVHIIIYLQDILHVVQMMEGTNLSLYLLSFQQPSGNTV